MAEWRLFYTKIHDERTQTLENNMQEKVTFVNPPWILFYLTKEKKSAAFL